MRLEYGFSYLPCQTCSAKIHCEQCQETIAGAILHVKGVEAAEVNIPVKTITVFGDSPDEDEFEDLVEDIQDEIEDNDDLQDLIEELDLGYLMYMLY